MEELEHWQNQLHEVTMLRCNMMTWSLHYVSSEVQNLPTYDGFNDVDVFLDVLSLRLSLKLLKGYGRGNHKPIFGLQILAYLQ